MSSGRGAPDPGMDRVWIRELVQEALVSGRPHEEICKDFPELLPEVRAFVEKALALQLELDMLFPPSAPA